MGSRSRSSSPVRTDRFGRLVPEKHSRSRSRSREHSKRSHSSSGMRDHSEHSRALTSRRSRSPYKRPVLRRNIPKSKRRIFKRDSHDRLISVSPSSSSSRTPTPPPRPYFPKVQRNPTNDTNINDPDLMKSRVFIGNLPIDKITKPEMEQIFSKYGNILGISIHDRGFGFVQFEKVEDGLRAVEVENGGLLKGKRIDVKMALTGRRGGPNKPPGPGRSPPPPGYERDRGLPPSGGVRDGRMIPLRPDNLDPSDKECYPPPPGARPPAERERSPLRGDAYDDRYRDPYRDRDPAAPLPPPRRDDPYYDRDPYRRPPPPDDPYYDRYREDPYRPRRDPYTDPYRDPYFRDYPYDPPPPKRPTPIDCEIIILNSKLQSYGEFLERKLKALSLFTKIVVISETTTIPQLIEDATKRNVLFAIVVNSQNEVHQSLILNILHGTPQEHRNMPVDDAISLVSRSFDQYTKTTREKNAAALTAAPVAAAAATATPSSQRSAGPFVPPSSDILYLLNLLADSRQLTIEELDKVINYLRDRRDKQLETDGGRAAFAGLGEQRKEESASLQREQQELQAKILSILNGPGDMGQGGIAPAKGPLQQRPGLPGQHVGNGTQQPGAQPGVSSLINFDSPSVQKALDNLIQSGPNLLKTISTPQGPSMVQRAPLMSRPDRPIQPVAMPRDAGYGGMNIGHAATAQQRLPYGQPMSMAMGAAPRQAPPLPGRRAF